MIPGPSYAENFTHRLGGFEIERTPTTAPVRLPERGQPEYEEEDEIDLPTAVGRLLAAKSQPFSISGRIPVNPADLTLFFRSQTDATHSLDFPVDVEYDTPPAFDVLIASCQPTPDSPPAPSIYPYAAPYMPTPSTGPSVLTYPPDLPFSTTLELANRPILDAVRTALLPTLPSGNYLIAVRDRLEVFVTGSRKRAQSAPADGRVATIIVGLPVKYRGGDLVVSPSASVGGFSPSQRQTDAIRERRERYHHSKKGEVAAMDWVAYTAECEAEVEPVRKGCRVDLCYAVHAKSFGPAGAFPDPLIVPSEDFRNMLGGVLNLTRGRKIGFYLTGEYGISPSEALAESLVPLLKGGDSLLYHALKLYQLAPELHWTAGGYLWPIDRAVDMAAADPVSPSSPARLRPLGGLAGNPLPQPPMPSVRGPFASGYAGSAGGGGYAASGGGYGGSSVGAYAGSTFGAHGGGPGGFAPQGGQPFGQSGFGQPIGYGHPQDEVEAMKARVEESGASPLAQADVTILADWNDANGGALVGVGKERVPFLAGGVIEKLVVNVLLIVYVA